MGSQLEKGLTRHSPELCNPPSAADAQVLQPGNRLPPDILTDGFGVSHVGRETLGRRFVLPHPVPAPVVVGRISGSSLSFDPPLPRQGYRNDTPTEDTHVSCFFLPSSVTSQAPVGASGKRGRFPWGSGVDEVG